jgi:hypothetical protein
MLYIETPHFVGLSGAWSGREDRHPMSGDVLAVSPRPPIHFLSSEHNNEPKTEVVTLVGSMHTINHRRGLVAIATDGRRFTTIDFLGSDPIHLGHQLEWDHASALGSTVYHNRTKATRINVNVQNHGVLESPGAATVAAVTKHRVSWGL